MRRSRPGGQPVFIDLIEQSGRPQARPLLQFLHPQRLPMAVSITKRKPLWPAANAETNTAECNNNRNVRFGRQGNWSVQIISIKLKKCNDTLHDALSAMTISTWRRHYTFVASAPPWTNKYPTAPFEPKQSSELNSENPLTVIYLTKTTHWFGCTHF